MHNHQSFKELKATARKSLEGNYGRAISLFISIELISLLTTYIVLILFSETTLINTICSEIVNFILSVFLQVLQIGVCFFYMKLQCNQPAGNSDIFYSFKTNRNTALLMGIVFTAVSYLTNLPALIFSHISSDLSLRYCLLLGGIVINFLIIIPIRQSYYISIDFPDLSIKQVLLFGIKLMKGNYFRYLLFTLSFLPLILISVLSCGIGLLWVLPYMDAALTAFYFDLVQNYNKNKSSI